MTTKLFTDFQNPGPAFRGKPFWAWNGRLEKAELIRQVHIMKQMGFGGFFMHSRTGLVTEYLGDEWFDLINACADEAEKLGMEAWLYDEDRWPSGLAGGLVTQHPEFRAKALEMEICKVADFATAQAKPNIVAMYLASVDGLNFSKAERLAAGKKPAAGEKRSLLVFRVVENVPSSFYNGYTYVDTLDRKATDEFIRLTHEEYRKRCGKRIGASIKGIFTDEPHRGRLMVGDCRSVPEDRQVPWTASLPARFKKDFGYDILDKLPDIYLRRDGGKVSQVKWHFVECLQRMFLDNFAKPYADWCRKNKLLVTGHILHEDTLSAQTAMSGSMMRYYEHMDYPGVDVLTRGNRGYWIVKQLSSAARQLGKTWLLSELYGCTGWDMPFSDHKAVGDWQALFGINLRCQHLSWYTMEGEAKRDYPASFIHHSTWWDQYDTVERYFARLGMLLQQGRPECDVLVLNPVESIWCQVHTDWAIWLDSRQDWAKELMKSYVDLFHWMAGAQIDFDYGDEEMMARLASVRPGKTPRIQVGKAEYRMVVVPRMVTLRATTLKLLEKFTEAGGTVVFADGVPAHVDALPSDAVKKLAARCRTLPSLEKTALISAIDEVLGWTVLRVHDGKGVPVWSIFGQMRRIDGGDVIVLMNSERQKAVDNVLVRIRSAGTVEEWNCVDGTRRVVPTRQRGPYLEFDESFQPGGERVYVVTRQPEPALPVRSVEKTVAKANWKGPFAYRLSEPNVCVLDAVRYRVGNGAWSKELEILKADRAVREQLNLPLRGGEMLQPWWVNRQTGGKPDYKGPVTFQYSFDVKELPGLPVDLAVESPGLWTIRLNGVELNPVTVSGWWVDVTLQRLPLPPGLIRQGHNVVELGCNFHYGSNPEAIFLLGGFGVTVNKMGSTLVAMPERLKLGSLVEQGLPFYSGSVVYSLPALTVAGRGRKVLQLPKIGGACARVGVDGTMSGVIPWHPYELDVTELLKQGGGALDLEVVTTRRNSFGPLHQYPASPDFVGPGNFLTSGESFKEDYVLVPTGLLAAPELHVRK